MSQNINGKQRGTNEFDLRRFFDSYLKIWSTVLLLCVMLTAAGALFASYTYVPSYTTHTTFVVSNKSSGGSGDLGSLTISDISASNALANTFKYILLSDEALTSVIRTYNLDITTDRLKSCINISPISNTNVLEMTVVTNKAELSKNIADKIIEKYPAVLERTLKSASLEVLNPPRRAAAPDSYRGYITYPALGIILALFLAAVYVYLKQVLKETVRTVADAEGRLGLTVLGAIPKIKAPADHNHGLFMTDKENGFLFMESFKALRTKIEAANEKKGYKTFIVTSALDNEGKTTVALNLSAALAANGKKVLLIDADLKSPAIYNMLERKEGLTVSGLDQVLLGGTTLEAAVLFDKSLGIYVLPHVSEILNSSELLSSPQMKNMIARAAQQYDVVMIDTPPAGILTDAAVITSYTDAVLLVVRQDYASVRAIESAVTGISDNKAELVGCILSLADSRNIGAGGAAYSRYHKYGGYRNPSGDGRRLTDRFKRFLGG